MKTKLRVENAFRELNLISCLSAATALAANLHLLFFSLSSFWQPPILQSWQLKLFLEFMQGFSQQRINEPFPLQGKAFWLSTSTIGILIQTENLIIMFFLSSTTMLKHFLGGLCQPFGQI